MLRESATATLREVDLGALVDRRVDSLLPGGSGLLDLVDVTVSRVDDGGAARDRVRVELGAAALIDAAGVIGNFEMMNRIADATGMPVGRGARMANADLIATLGLERFDHLD